MTTVKNFNIIEGISNQLKLQRFFEQLPDKLGNTILPVFIVNEIGQQKTHIFTALAVSTPVDFTVPRGKRWEVESIFFVWTSSATAGNRQVTLDIFDDNGVLVYQTVAALLLAASGALRYAFGPYFGTNANSLSVEGFGCMPKHLKSGWVVRIHDRVNIDEAGDIVTGVLNYLEFQSAETGA